MATIKIYVPEDLKADMDAADRQEPKPNWSATAQEAFRLECERQLNRKRSKGKMDAVIERLRASKQKRESKDRVSGHKVGRDWAMGVAEADVLERVAKWSTKAAGGEDGWQLQQWKSIAGALAGDQEWDRDDAAVFWADWADNPEPSDDFVIGFAEGAAEVWDEVADKL